MIGIMNILKAAVEPNRIPKTQSTHPDLENRKEKVRASIQKYKKRILKKDASLMTNSNNSLLRDIYY